MLGCVGNLPRMPLAFPLDNAENAGNMIHAKFDPCVCADADVSQRRDRAFQYRSMGAQRREVFR